MHIVHVEQFGGPDALQLIEQPTPTPQAGQIVVEVKASGINFADIMARQGSYPGVPSAPFDPGFEVAGVVSAVGEGVSGFGGGERVMGLVQSGGYATHAVLDASTAFRLPDGLDFAPATALLIQGLTAYFLLEAGQLSAGKSVLIPGAAGGVGSLAIQIAKLRGAGQVIGLASPAKHDLVRSLGADTALDYTKPGWAQQVMAETGGKGVDIFLDSQGDLAGEGFDALGQKAHWLVFGSQSGSGSPLTPARLWAIMGKNASLRGFNVYGSNAPDFGRAMTDMLGWVGDGKLRIDVQRFPLADVARAQEAISNRQTTGKVVLEP